MLAVIKGTVMNKEVVDSKDGQKKYYSYDLYQKGNPQIEKVNCDKPQFEKIKEGDLVTVQVNAQPQERYGNVSMYTRQLAS